MAITYTFTGFDTPFVPNVAKDVSIRAVSTADTPLGHYKFTVKGQNLSPADVQINYKDAGDTDFTSVLPMTLVGSDLVGYFGPSTGFVIGTGGVPLDATTPFKITVAPNNSGSYQLSVDFVSPAPANASLGLGAGSVNYFVFTADPAADGDHEVDPISRIEGHLGVKLTTTAGMVTEADVHGNLWRGFENFLIGREPNDAITFTQRICGVCPIPHATASTFAVESVIGYNSKYITFADDSGVAGVPKKAVYVRNLVYASEFLMSAITHFYHLAAPSYVQGPAIPPWTPYFNDSYYHPLLRSAGHGTDGAGGTGALPLNVGGFSKDLWSAVIKQYVKALRIRRLTFEAGALFAGRMPMVASFVAGGVTLNKDEDLGVKIGKFRKLLEEVGQFIMTEHVPLVLALSALYPEYDNRNNGGQGYGGGCGNFLAWGAFPHPDTNNLAIKGGVKIGSGDVSMVVANKTDVAAAVALVESQLVESIANSHYADYASAEQLSANPHEALPKNVQRTVPDRTVGYSWLKAPRWKVAGENHPMEVGPFARLVVNGLYPVDGSLLATTFNADGIAGYLAYAKRFTGTPGVGTVVGGVEYGIDPVMVNPDLAVALVREGLAKVYLPSGTEVTDEATIVSSYSGAIIAGTVGNWILGLKGGLSLMDRLRGRALEAAYLVQCMIGGYAKTASTVSGFDYHFGSGTGGWLGGLAGLSAGAPSYVVKAVPTGPVSGFGVSEAPRGALAHFISIDKGKISAYQCVVPTTWNACPKDGNADPVKARGPMEAAMVGIPFSGAGASFTDRSGNPKDTQGGVEALRVAQSFDPCIACAVH